MLDVDFKILSYISEKKRGSIPRPVRIGEVWRRLVAKHLLGKHIPFIRRHMLDVHQYGVVVPGGSEILLHSRHVAEEAIRRDASRGVWAFVDIDLVNCFPSLEWDEINETMLEQMPDLAPWTEWCHKIAADII